MKFEKDEAYEGVKRASTIKTAKKKQYLGDPAQLIEPSPKFQAFDCKMD